MWSADQVLEEEIPQQSCSICLDSKYAGKAFKCYHLYCSDCLQRYLSQKIYDFSLIVCPQCSSEIDESSDTFKKLPIEQLNKYTKIKFLKQIEKNPELKVCPNQNCDYGVLKANNNEEGYCNICKKRYCLRCRDPFHEGKKCNEDIAKKLNKKFSYIRCQGCLKVVQKITGCNHMTCRCGFNFCYNCGLEWNSSHKCPFWSNDELVVVRLKNYLRYESSDESKMGKLGEQIFNFLLKIVLIISIIGWALLCILLSVIMFVLCIPGYLIRGNYILWDEIGKRCCQSYSNRQKLIMILWLIFLPISSVMIASYVFYIDTKSGTNRMLFRICFLFST